MQESPFNDLVIQRGVRQNSIESTLAILKARFPDDDVDPLIPRLEAIDDINLLKQVNLNASFADSFLEFHKTLP